MSPSSVLRAPPCSTNLGVTPRCLVLVRLTVCNRPTSAVVLIGNGLGMVGGYRLGDIAVECPTRLSRNLLLRCMACGRTLLTPVNVLRPLGRACVSGYSERLWITWPCGRL